MSEQKYRTVNKALGLQPRFGPFPADQVFPWMGISFTFYLFFREVCHLDWLWVVLLITWGCSTWWLLTGSKSWKFLSKFISTPNWSRGRVRYHSFLAFAQVQASSQKSIKKSKSKTSKRKRS